MSLADGLYERTTDQDPDQPTADDAIPEQAVAGVPRNYTLNALNGTCTKLAEQLASPGAVLPLLLGIVSAPVGFVGLLEPIRRSASLVPQLATAGRMRSSARRKGFWVLAGNSQALALLLILLGAATLEGTAAGLVIVGGLALFSFASGVGSVAFGDVVGKTIPESKRGQLLSFRATSGGLFTLLVGFVLVTQPSDELGTYLVLLGAAALLWVVAAGLFGSIDEPPSETRVERGMLDEARAGLSAIREVDGLRMFTIARGLLIAVEVALPFLIIFTRQELDAGGILAVSVISIGLANLLSNVIWGRISDLISTRATMITAGLLGSLTVASILLVGALAGPTTPVIAFAPIFFLATAAESGIRNGRKAWVVNASPEQERPLWVAATNTVAGLITLSFAALGLLAELTSVIAVIWTLLALSLAGVLAAYLMPDDSAVAAG